MAVRGLIVAACLCATAFAARAETPEDIDAACATALQRDEVIRTFFEALPTDVGAGHLDDKAVAHLSVAVTAVFVAGRNDPTSALICRGIEVLRRSYGLVPRATVISDKAPEPVAVALQGCEGGDSGFNPLSYVLDDIGRINRSGGLSDVEYGAFAAYFTTIRARIADMEIDPRSLCLSLVGPWVLYRR